MFVPKDKFNLTDLNTGLKTTVTITPTKGTVAKRLIMGFAPLLVMSGIAAIVNLTDEDAKESLTEDTDMQYPNRTV